MPKLKDKLIHLVILTGYIITIAPVLGSGENDVYNCNRCSGIKKNWINYPELQYASFFTTQNCCSFNPEGIVDENQDMYYDEDYHNRMRSSFNTQKYFYKDDYQLRNNVESKQNINKINQNANSSTLNPLAAFKNSANPHLKSNPPPLS